MDLGKLKLALAALVWLCACAHTPTSGGRTSLIAFYKGTAIVHQSEGHDVPGGLSYRKRTLDPAQGTITEQVVRASADASEKPSENVTTFKVNGSHFVFVSSVGTNPDGSRETFTDYGKEDGGELVGEPWHWKRWTTSVHMPEGVVVTSEEALDGDRLTVETTVTQASTPQLRVSERFEAIDEGTFEAARKQLLGL